MIPDPEFVIFNDAATQASFPVATYRYGLAENPPIICVHGLTRNAADFYYLATALSTHYHVICVDVPGRGKSPNFNNPALYHNVFYASLFAQWLESHNLPPVHFIGTSMGGIIGMMLAAAKPQRIRSLILNDVGTYVPASEISRLKTYVGVDTTADQYETLAARLAKPLEQFGIKDAAVREHFIAHSIEATPDGGYRLRYDPEIRQSLLALEDKPIDLSELWKLVTCPTLLIRGALSELFPANIAEAMLTAHAKASLYVVEGSGHAPSLSTQAEIEHIQQWLAQTSQ